MLYFSKSYTPSKALRWQRDQRLNVRRQEKSTQLQARILDLCTRAGETLENPKLSVDEATFIRFQNELVNDVASLFVFVDILKSNPQ